MAALRRPVPFLAAAALSVGLQLRVEYRGPRWQVYLFKPSTTALLLLLAVLSTSAHGARYQPAVVVGLACSLVGDVLLMLPRDRIVAGLASFLLAHLAYVVACSAEAPIGTAPALLLPLAAMAAPLLWLLWPGLGKLRLPVVVYSATILLMVWQAWGWQWASHTPGTRLAAVGAALFMASDAVLALNRFRRPFRGAQAVIMLTYVAAQAPIALSVGTG